MATRTGETLKRVGASVIQSNLRRRERKPGVSTRTSAVAVLALVVVAAVAVYGAYDLSGTGGSAGKSSSTTVGATTSGNGSGTTSPAVGEISISKAKALMLAAPASATVIKDIDEMIFTSSNLSITAFTIASQNATSITGTHPLLPAQGEVFVIGGLINPALFIPANAKVRFTVINMDDAMYNDLVITAIEPPYPANMSRYMTWVGSPTLPLAYQGFLYMMPVLSPANYGAGWAPTYSYTVTIPDYGHLWYLCTYPGHAQGGMYGEIFPMTQTSTSTSTSTAETATSFITSTSSGTVFVFPVAPNSSFTSTVPPTGTIPIGEAITLLKTPLTGANVSRSADSITFTSLNVSLVAFAVPSENATGLTGMQPPSYSQGDVFIVDGLVNPTLRVPRGASLHVTVVNLDANAYHDLDVSTLSPPYSYMTMQGMMWGGPFLYMMPVLSPANYAGGWAFLYSYTVTVPNVASLWYLCTYPGHAQSGMYGEIVTG